jgi:Recombination endonuclease VII
MAVEQRCGCCYHSKPVDDFWPVFRGKNGNRCRQCVKDNCKANRPARDCIMCGISFIPVQYPQNSCSPQCNTRLKQIKRYGITPEEYRAMVEEQDNKCAICFNLSPTANLYIDHDHTTGKVRGLLCRDCNSGIGLLHDDPALLQNALWYLKEND